MLGLALLLFLGCNGLAQATYYHFEDYRPDDVSFTHGSSYSWTFDLKEDDLSLWVIPAVPLQNGGSAWSYLSASAGLMGESDILHRAYLTMRFQGATGDYIDMLFDNSLFGNSMSMSNGGPGIDVFTQLNDDHFLTVTMTSVSGNGFKVDWMKLTGCYETAPVPTPEPGTLILLGAGLVGLAVLMRKKE